mgnify:CR=1 FL=1|jgi:ArsR family transcriptional regulator
MNEYLVMFKALGDKTRLRIVLMLKVKPLCVCEIREIIGSSMSTISNHLKVLKDANIITSIKVEKYINYSLNSTNNSVLEVLELLAGVDSGEIQNDIEKAMKTDRVNIC